MDFTFTKSQDKGFDIVARAIKRKYPFIKGITFDEKPKMDVILFVGLIVDYYKFFEVTGEDEDTFLKERGDKFKITYFKSFGRLSTFTSMIDPKSRGKDKYSWNFMEGITKEMNKIYNGLPKNYQLYFKPVWAEKEILVSLHAMNITIVIDLKGEGEETSTQSPY
jgi:hypothetical protein